VPRELIPIVFFNIVGLVAIAFSPIGRAIARRIGGGRLDESEVAELRAEVAELRDRLAETEERLGGELDEVHNRLDFAERVVARQRSADALRSGS
jgi:hypothetical protein